MTDESDKLAEAAGYDQARMDRLAEALFNATLEFAAAEAGDTGVAILNARESLHAAIKLAAVMTYTTVLSAGDDAERADFLKALRVEVSGLFTSAVEACAASDPTGQVFADALGAPVIGALEDEPADGDAP
jgi:hypothetical protein